MLCTLIGTRIYRSAMYFYSGPRSQRTRPHYDEAEDEKKMPCHGSNAEEGKIPVQGSDEERKI